MNTYPPTHHGPQPVPMKHLNDVRLSYKASTSAGPSTQGSLRTGLITNAPLKIRAAAKLGFVTLLMLLAQMALVGTTVLSASAAAQPAPAQVVQGTDGSLYMLQGGKAWTLVPGQISDATVADLKLSGQIDGTIPADLFSVPAPADQAPQAQIRVDVNQDLNLVSTGTCSGPRAKTSKLIVSLASVDRQADGRTVWHVGLLNHASVPISVASSWGSKPSAVYMVAGDGTKYTAFAIDDPTVVAVEERKSLDVIPQQNNMPAGVYRLFFAAERFWFGTDTRCDGWLWSSTPISLP